MENKVWIYLKVHLYWNVKSSLHAPTIAEEKKWENKHKKDN